MSEGMAAPGPESSCRHCRATNDPGASECWLCSCRDWRGPPLGRPSHLEPTPTLHSPHRTIAGLPGIGPASRRPWFGPLRTTSGGLRLDLVGGMALITTILATVVCIGLPAGPLVGWVMLIPSMVILAFLHDRSDR
jgi:hypothetical protein